jgi:enamine deaminase RidA (YjgF/YER057c/UK114 family)
MRPDEDKSDARTEYFGVPWEQDYGYPQAVQNGDRIYVSGQFSHDMAGHLIAPAPVDAKGRILDTAPMEQQMRATYANAAQLLPASGLSRGRRDRDRLRAGHGCSHGNRRPR